MRRRIQVSFLGLGKFAVTDASLEYCQQYDPFFLLVELGRCFGYQILRISTSRFLPAQLTSATSWLMVKLGG